MIKDFLIKGSANFFGFGIEITINREKNKFEYRKPFSLSLILTDKWRWHSCEHKLAKLVTTGTPVTLENLKSISPIEEGCGSEKQLYLLVSIFLFGAVSTINILCGLLIAIVCYFFLKRFYENKYLILKWQELFMVEPTEEQYQVALGIGKGIETWINGKFLFKYNELGNLLAD